MSDKLQEIKLLAQNAMATGKGHVDLTTYALTWLIEQLEQAQQRITELENGYEECRDERDDLHSKLMANEAANQKLVECLEWYAKEKTYNLQVTISMGSSFASHEPIKYDKGQRARQTLSELCEVKGNDRSDS